MMHSQDPTKHMLSRKNGTSQKICPEPWKRRTAAQPWDRVGGNRVGSIGLHGRSGLECRHVLSIRSRFYWLKDFKATSNREDMVFLACRRAGHTPLLKVYFNPRRFIVQESNTGYVVAPGSMPQIFHSSRSLQPTFYEFWRSLGPPSKSLNKNNIAPCIPAPPAPQILKYQPSST